MDDTEIKLTFKNSVTGQSKLEKYAETLKNIQSFSNGIDKGTLKAIDESAKGTKTISSETEKTAKNINKAFNFGAINQFAKSIKNAVYSLSKMTDKSMSFLETINLYQVAFSETGKSIEETTKETNKFINTLSEMYGLDESWLTNTVAKFKQLSNAMGIVGDTGTQISKILTQLSIDTSSLYNVEPSEAVSKFTSALAGQTKPVRSFGADITESTLQQTLGNIGIDKQVSQLSYAEKRITIIISLLQQLGQVTNDWGNTIESPANQTRILSQQWERLTRAIGNVFLPILAKILPYLNAILMVLTEIISTVATLLGFNANDFNYGITELDDSVVDLVDNLDNASDSAKKLKSGLRGFDKLNVITTPSETSSKASVGSGIDTSLTNALGKAYEKYNNSLTEVSMNATKIRDTIMEWLGFTKLTDDATKKVSFKFEKITSGTVLGSLAVGGAIFTGIKIIASTLLKLTGLKLPSLFAEGGMFAGAGSTIAVIGLVAASIGLLSYALYDLYKTNDDFKNKFDKNWEEIGKTVEPIGENIKKLFETLAETYNKTLKPFLEELWNTIKIIAETIYDILYPIFNEFILPSINQIITIITDLFKIFNELWAEFGKPIFELINKAIQSVGEIFQKIWEQFLHPVVEKIIEIVGDLWETTLKPMFKKVGQAVGNVIEFLLVLWNNVLAPIVKWLIDTLAPHFETIFSFIGDVVYTVVKFIGGVINGLLDIFNGIIKFFTGVFSGDWKKALDGIVDILKGIVNIIISVVEGIINGVISLINLGIKSIFNGIKSLVNKVLSSVESIAKVLGFDIDLTLKGSAPQIPKVTIPRLKAGIDFVPNDFYPAYLDYGERVLTKDENKEYSSMLNGNSNNLSKNANFSPTIIVKVGDEEVARKVLNNLQDIAKTNGKPIEIG